MDLSQEELQLQREALLRFEQERKDEEQARRLQQIYAAERADATLTPEQIDGILNNEREVIHEHVRSQPRIVIRPNSFATISTNRSTGATRVSVTTANQQAGPSMQHHIRRRVFDETNDGEPSARRPRVGVELVTNGNRQRITFSIRGRGSPASSSDEDEDEEENSDNQEDEEDEIDDEDAMEDEEELEEDSDDDVVVLDADTNDRSMENAVFYRGEMEVADVDDSFVMNPSSRIVIRSQQRQSSSLSTTITRDPQFGECTLCFEAPCDPTGCNKCKQLIGCKKCVNTWHSTALRGLSLPSCPLCRFSWSNLPDVKPMRLIAAEKSRPTRLLRSAARRENSEQ